MPDQLSEIVAEILNLETADVNEGLSMENTELWDSLNHLRIMTAVEDEFGVTFSMEEIESIRDVRKMRQIVADHIDNR